MALDERLQDELPRSTGRLQPDVDAAFERVVETARRRQRRRRGMAFALAGVLLVVGAGSASYWDDVAHLGGAPEPVKRGPTTKVPTPPNPILPGGSARLTGEWQTSPVSETHVRSALATAGVAPATSDRVLDGAHRWVVQLTFSTSLAFETWDPGRPIASLRVTDAFASRLVSHHRLVVTPQRPTTRWTFTYQVAGDQLRLHLIDARGRPAPVQTARFVAWTAAPFTLVR